MNNTQLKHALADLDIKQADLAALIGVSQITVSRWARGVQKIPEPAAILIRLMVMHGKNNMPLLFDAFDLGGGRQK